MQFNRPKVIAALLFMLLMLAGQAQAHLIVTPLRVVFENRMRSESLLLMNTDNRPHTYRLGWKLMRMEESGQYVDVPMDSADPYGVQNMVVFAPRQVTLVPNGRQNIRLSLRRPADLPPGEYRAHLLFSEVPEDPKDARNDKDMGFSLQVTVGVSIPVIVRNGVAGGAVVLSNPSLERAEGSQSLRVDLNHAKGAGSVYGRVVVFSGDRQVGIVNNVALYPEMGKRVVTVPLSAEIPAGSSVRIAYEGGAEYAGRTLSEKNITISK